MTMTCLGYVQHQDPLYGFLQCEIQPKLGLFGNLDYRVFRLRASNSVYLYEETCSKRRVIGKFYYHSGMDRGAAHSAMIREFSNLEYMRSLGFGGFGNHYIARPLGQGDQRNLGVNPDYVIYRFEELPTAIRFLEAHA